MALNTAGIVVTDIAFDHPDELQLTGKTPAIVTLPLEYAPEALHRTVVDAVCHTGHTLRHPCFLELMVKGSASVLEASVAME